MRGLRYDLDPCGEIDLFHLGAGFPTQRSFYDFRTEVRSYSALIACVKVSSAHSASRPTAFHFMAQHFNRVVELSKIAPCPLVAWTFPGKWDVEVLKFSKVLFHSQIPITCWCFDGSS